MVIRRTTRKPLEQLPGAEGEKYVTGVHEVQRHTALVLGKTNRPRRCVVTNGRQLDPGRGRRGLGCGRAVLGQLPVDKGCPKQKKEKNDSHSSLRRVQVVEGITPPDLRVPGRAQELAHSPAVRNVGPAFPEVRLILHLNAVVGRSARPAHHE